MMGYQKEKEPELFHYGFSLERRIRENHPLRKIKAKIDFDFIREEVKELYGYNGNESVDPSVILRIIFLLFYYDVRSERELMLTIPERLDWLWFLGYDVEDKIPNHSVLSKARNKWGVEVFKQFFVRIVEQCCEEGLVDGKKLFCDSTLVEADASKNSVLDRKDLRFHLNKKYKELELKLDERDDPARKNYRKVNNKKISLTDPDAGITSRGNGNPELTYKVHRGVDEKHEIITATEVTRGDKDEGHYLNLLIKEHSIHTGKLVKTAVGDSKYGTRENIINCVENGINPHLKDLLSTQKTSGRRDKIFDSGYFKYDKTKDHYICPSGKTLKRRKIFKKRKAYEYAAKETDCKVCQIKAQCTRGRWRTLKRYVEQEFLDIGLEICHSRASKADLKKRQHISERSFADGKTRFGLRRARWRNLWRVEIQEFLIATIQNIQKLIRYGEKHRESIAKTNVFENIIRSCNEFVLFTQKMIRNNFYLENNC